MKIVNKYELATMPFGTPYYQLDKWGNIVGEGLYIHSGHNWMCPFDNTPMFVGGISLLPESKEECYGQFNEGELPDNFELIDNGCGSTDYGDNDRFLVLDAKELKIIIEFLTECYNNIKKD